MRKGESKPLTGSGAALPLFPTLTVTTRVSMGRKGKKSNAARGRGAAARSTEFAATTDPVGASGWALADASAASGAKRLEIKPRERFALPFPVLLAFKAAAATASARADSVLGFKGGGKGSVRMPAVGGTGDAPHCTTLMLRPLLPMPAALAAAASSRNSEGDRPTVGGGCEFASAAGSVTAEADWHAGKVLPRATLLRGAAVPGWGRRATVRERAPPEPQAGEPGGGGEEKEIDVVLPLV